MVASRKVSPKNLIGIFFQWPVFLSAHIRGRFDRPFCQIFTPVGLTWHDGSGREANILRTFMFCCFRSSLGWDETTRPVKNRDPRTFILNAGTKAHSFLLVVFSSELTLREKLCTPVTPSLFRRHTIARNCIHTGLVQKQQEGVIILWAWMFRGKWVESRCKEKGGGKFILRRRRKQSKNSWKLNKFNFSKIK